MSAAAITKRLQRRVRKHNGGLRTQALIEAAMGLGVTLGTYGLIFGVTWVIGWFVFATESLSATWFALAITGVFFLVAVISAWRKVDLAADLVPLPDKNPTVEWMEQTLSVVGGGSTVNPRYAIAGAAMLLISGPANLLDAWATWRQQLSGKEVTLQNAAALLKRCRSGATAKQISDPHAAILLRRLLLIRVVTTGESPRLELTDRGGRLLEKSA